MKNLSDVQRKARLFLKGEFHSEYELLGYKETGNDVTFFFGNYFVGVKVDTVNLDCTFCKIDSLDGFTITASLNESLNF
jgi:hypothetical protein